MTKREQILQSVLLKLKTINLVDPKHIVRSRVDPFNISKLPYITLEPVVDKPDSEVLGFLDWLFTIRISIYTKGDVPDSIADPIIEAIHNVMLSDESLNGLLMDMKPLPILYDFNEGEKPLLKTIYDFELKYRTNF